MIFRRVHVGILLRSHTTNAKGHRHSCHSDKTLGNDGDSQALKEKANQMSYYETQWNVPEANVDHLFYVFLPGDTNDNNKRT